jgi:hypothetical protein
MLSTSDGRNASHRRGPWRISRVPRIRVVIQDAVIAQVVRAMQAGMMDANGDATRIDILRTLRGDP